MEVAGLALGVYPIVWKLLSQYRDGARFVKNYRQFLNNYTSFIIDIGIQQQKFEEVLYDLMCTSPDTGPEPFIPGSITMQQFLDKVRSKDYKDWNHQRLHGILAIRLDDSYELVLERLNEIWRTFKELERLLQIQEVRFQNFMRLS